MKLNKSNFLRLCEAAWDLSHDGTGKDVFLSYSPHVAKLELNMFLEGWKVDTRPDTVYTFTEANGSTFSQSCDPDDILEALQMMVKKKAWPEGASPDATLRNIALGMVGLDENSFKKTGGEE